jgi:GMP synthase (glutamine-hydrolysing)
MEKRIVILQHCEQEGPGVIADFFRSAAWATEIVDFTNGDSLPTDFDDIAAIVALGGPMNAYEEDLYPFLRDEEGFIVRTMVEEIPFLGICLGAQLLAKAWGAQITRSPHREIGWYRVKLTGDGQRDRLFREIPERLHVFQWHEDAFEIPEGGVLLVKGEGCRNQAFRIGACAYGLQFHVEMSPEMVETWINGEKSELDTRGILRDTVRLKEEYEKLAARFLWNFTMLIQGSLRIKRVIRMFVEDEKSQMRKRPIAWWLTEEAGLEVALKV